MAYQTPERIRECRLEEWDEPDEQRCAACDKSPCAFSCSCCGADCDAEVCCDIVSIDGHDEHGGAQSGWQCLTHRRVGEDARAVA